MDSVGAHQRLMAGIYVKQYHEFPGNCAMHFANGTELPAGISCLQAQRRCMTEGSDSKGHLQGWLHLPDCAEILSAGNSHMDHSCNALLS